MLLEHFTFDTILRCIGFQAFSTACSGPKYLTKELQILYLLVLIKCLTGFSSVTLDSGRKCQNGLDMQIWCEHYGWVEREESWMQGKGKESGFDTVKFTRNSILTSWQVRPGPRKISIGKGHWPSEANLLQPMYSCRIIQSRLVKSHLVQSFKICWIWSEFAQGVNNKAMKGACRVISISVTIWLLKIY